MSDLTAIVGAAGILLNALAALWWGSKTIAAKDTTIASLNTHIGNLASAQSELIKAKDSQIAGLESHAQNLATVQGEVIKAKEGEIVSVKNQIQTLTVAQAEVIKAKDERIQSLKEQIEQLNRLNPKALGEFNSAVKLQLEEAVGVLNTKLQAANGVIESKSQLIEEMRMRGDTKAEISKVEAEKKHIEEKTLQIQLDVAKDFGLGTIPGTEFKMDETGAYVVGGLNFPNLNFPIEKREDLSELLNNYFYVPRIKENSLSDGSVTAIGKRIESYRTKANELDAVLNGYDISPGGFLKL